MTTENQISAPSELLDKIEQQWIGRAKTQNIVPSKAMTKGYMNAEGEFFIGAMAALGALDYVVPPRWFVQIISGRPIVSMERLRA